MSERMPSGWSRFLDILLDATTLKVTKLVLDLSLIILWLWVLREVWGGEIMSTAALTFIVWRNFARDDAKG